jgi:hypothetical protein
METISIERKTQDLFRVVSNFGYWSDGGNIDELVAFDKNGMLCNMRAQSLERAAGRNYIIICPFFVVNLTVLTAARALEVGQSTVVSL